MWSLFFFFLLITAHFNTQTHTHTQVRMRVYFAEWLCATENTCNACILTKLVPKVRATIERFDIQMMKVLAILSSSSEEMDEILDDDTRKLFIRVSSSKNVGFTSKNIKVSSLASRRMTSGNKKSGQRLRSHNTYIDRALGDEDGTDAYADLEEWIVNSSEGEDDNEVVEEKVAVEVIPSQQQLLSRKRRQKRESEDDNDEIEDDDDDDDDDGIALEDVIGDEDEDESSSTESEWDGSDDDGDYE